MGDDDRPELSGEEVAKLREEELKAAEVLVTERKEVRERNSQKTGGVVPRTLKSDLKKSAAVVKRLKSFTADDAEWCMTQLKAFNLTRYVSELVQALVQAVTDGKLKPGDCPEASRIISFLHCTYADFTDDLLTSLQKQLDTSSLGISSTADNTQVSVTRSLSRLLMELYATGVCSDIKVIKNLFKVIFSQGSDQGIATPGDRSVSLVAYLLRHYGYEVFGFVSAAMRSVKDAPCKTKEDIKAWAALMAKSEAQHKVFTEQESTGFKGGFKKYFTKTVASFGKMFEDFEALHQEGIECIKNKGELPDDKKAGLDEARKNLDKFIATTNQLADSLDTLDELPDRQDLTKFQTGETSTNITFMSGMASYYAPVEDFGTASLYDDEEQRAFYEDFPDLTAVLPEWFTSPGMKKQLAKSGKQQAEEETAKEEDKPEKPTTVTFSQGTEDKVKKKKDDKDTKEKEGKDKEKRAPNFTAIDELLKAMVERCSGKVSADLWLQEYISESFNPPGCDANTESSFVMSFAASCRKKLSKAIFDVPRNSFNLFPQYARIAAACTEIWKDFGPNLVNAFEDEFERQNQQQNQLWIEERRRNIRMLSELCKAKLCLPPMLLRCQAQLIDNFVHHNIEVACHLVEVAGRFLYRNAAASVRFQNLMQHMKRQKEQKHMDPRQEMLIDNALQEARPPELDPKKVVKKLKTVHPTEAFIRHLLFTKLNRQNMSSIAVTLRKLDWSDKRVMKWVTSNLKKAQKIKYAVVHVFASLASTLGEYHPDVPVILVDKVLESIRLGLEICTPVTDGQQPVSPQKRLLELKLLGDLYVYKVIEEQTLFEVMYTLLYYAGWNDHTGHYFRIRMVLTLFDNTISHITETQGGRRRLFRFLPFLYQYIHAKAHPFPVDIDYKLADLMDTLYEHIPKQSRTFATFPDTIGGANAMVKGVVEVLEGGKSLSHNERLLGGKSLGLLKYITNLREALGNPGVPIEGKKQLLSNSIVPFRTKVHPLNMTSEVDMEEEEEEEEQEPEEDLVIHKEAEDEAPQDETPQDEAHEEEEEEEEEEEDEDTSHDEDYSRGKFLIPVAFRSTKKKALTEEEEEFDALFNDTVKGMYDEVKQKAAMKHKGGKLDDKIAATMNLPLASVVKAGDKQRQAHTNPTSGSTAFTVVLRRKAEGNASVKVGSKSLGIGVLQVPSESALASGDQEAHKTRMRLEEEDARKRTMQLHEQSQALEAHEAGIPTYKMYGAGRKR